MKPVIRTSPLAAAAVVLAVVLAGCGRQEAVPAAPAAAPAPLPVPAPVAEAKEVQRLVYRCADGRALVLRLHEDQRARVDLDHETQVLRPVPVDGGTLYLGDHVNVRIAGDRATASRDGIVLMANCQAQPATESGAAK